jgi:hypothetical protein
MCGSSIIGMPEYAGYNANLSRITGPIEDENVEAAGNPALEPNREMGKSAT